MGTRNLTIAVVDGTVRLAQYGQWDGYPSGQGKTILEFMSTLLASRASQNTTESKYDSFLTNLRSTSPITDEQIKQSWRAAGATAEQFAARLIPMDISDEHARRYPALSRDTGADVLNHILVNANVLVHNRLEFAQDGLFCEYAYVLDFDKQQFEVYTGWHTEPAPEGTDISRFGDTLNGDYYPVRLAVTYPFDALPSVEQLETGVNAPINDG